MAPPLRQNRHRPDPPDRKSLAKRQSGAVVRRKPVQQRATAVRMSGAVNRRRQEGSLLQRLLSAVLPGANTRRPAAVPIPPATSRETVPPYPQQEQKSLLNRLLDNSATAKARPVASKSPSEEMTPSFTHGERQAPAPPGMGTTERSSSLFGRLRDLGGTSPAASERRGGVEGDVPDSKSSGRLGGSIFGRGRAPAPAEDVPDHEAGVQPPVFGKRVPPAEEVPPASSRLLGGMLSRLRPGRREVEHGTGESVERSEPMVARGERAEPEETFSSSHFDHDSGHDHPAYDEEPPAPPTPPSLAERMPRTYGGEFSASSRPSPRGAAVSSSSRGSAGTAATSSAREKGGSGLRTGAGLLQGLLSKVIRTARSTPPRESRRTVSSAPQFPTVSQREHAPSSRSSATTPLMERLLSRESQRERGRSVEPSPRSSAPVTPPPASRAPAPRPPLPKVPMFRGPAPREGPSIFQRLMTRKSRDKAVLRSSFVRGPVFGPAGTPYVDKTNPQARLTFMLGFFVLAFSILALRAVDLTVVQADYLQQKARSQHKKKITLTASRGRILDRNGRTMAISLPMNSLSVEVDQVEDRDHLANNLADIIGVPVEELRNKLRSFKAGTYPTIKHQLTPEITRKVRNLDHHALFFFPESRRFYAMGEVTGHILGFVNFEGRGREGLERSFEDDLHGVNGAQVISHDRLGRPMPMVRTVTEPHPGVDLSTTIDTTIQYIAYRALLKGVQNSQAKAGMAVVMDPNNGEILAMVNQPSFNPNNLAHSKSNDRRNRVVTDLFEPGSTFKVFTVAAALDKGTVTPDTIIDIEYGKTRVADRVITDFHRGTRYLSVSQVLQRSSNVGAAKIGLGLGLEQQDYYIRRFGFGARTGIELPSDPSGVIPDVTHYRKVGLANRSYGYGITTTPLHITTAFAASINGGIYYPPTLIKGKIVDGVVVPMKQKPPPHRVISEDTSKKLRKILQSVVTDEGTAIEAAVDGYQVGGKTGTARKAIPGQGYVRGKYYASFVGFIPVEKPKVVIFVSIDEPVGVIYGGKVAAPVFKEIAQEILPRLSIFPDTHTDPPLPDMMDPVPPDSETVENVSLGQALEILGKKGIVPQVSGSGVVKSLETPTEGPPRLIMQ
ncbi:MAG: hypothetical protein HQL79_09015 [Magnetococcales bacterium]|nr:hypothetical protein [Magnetococcales bacterium]